MRVFHAKILLFGEYSVVAGSSALSVPFFRYSGQLGFEKEQSADVAASQESIREWLNYMRSMDPVDFPDLNIETLAQDLDKGLYFRSDIPRNYGLGSSGALIAAIFDHYMRSSVAGDISSEILGHLKLVLAKAESFFHGTSSGFDPVSIMAGRPLLYQDGRFSFPDIKKVEAVLSCFYLIDTGQSSSTGVFVNKFLEQVRKGKMKSAFEKSYLPAVEKVVQASCGGDIISLNRVMPAISDFQYEYMQDMIPQRVKKIWEQGLNSGNYYLKICGSGGGGYMLLWALTDPSEIERKFGVSIIPVR